MSIRTLVPATCGLVVAAAAWPLAALSDDLPEPRPFEAREFEFRVLLDGKEIGSHRYNVRQSGDVRLVESRARFDVKFLFFTAYRYRHNLSARWRDGCLESLEADTYANREKLSVSGERRGGAFVVESGGNTQSLPACVMNFAYWNPLILQQPKLLNPQTGQYLDVDIEPTGQEQIALDGRRLTADGYRIRAKDMRIDLWYSRSSGQWVALESLTKDDRVIRYELSDGWVTETEESEDG